MQEKKQTLTTENNLFENLWFKLFPYWMLFILLVGSFLVVAFLVAQREKPSYTVAASIAINDEEAALANNQPIRALNAFSIRQTVDNEVLVLQSRALMVAVVKNLHLYAPVGQQGRFTEATLYSSSPVIVEALQPDSIEKKTEKIYFSFHPGTNTIEINNRHYRLAEWIRFPYGTLRFVRNPRNVAPTNNHYYFSLSPPTAVATSLRSGLTATSVSKLSTVINLSFKAENADKAADILNELLRVYMRRTVDIENKLAANTLSFVEQRLRDVEADLDSIERRIQQFRTARGVIDLSQQGRLYLESVAENDRRITEINTQLAVLNQVEQFINSEGAGTGLVPTTLGINDPVLAELLQRLNNLELQRASLRTTTGDENPLVNAVENEIRKIRPNIRNIVANQRARLVASRNNFSATTDRANSSIQNIPAQERQLLEISRQQAVKRDLYSFLLQRREEAALSNSSNASNSQVIDWADSTAAAVSSKKMFYLLGAVIAAIALAIAYILYREAFHGKVQFRSSIEKLTLMPIIGELFFRRKSDPLRLQHTPYKATLEQFRKIQTALGLFQSMPRQRKILISSSVPKEGKTYVSSHFAASLALSGSRVAFLDFHLSQPDASRQFGFDSVAGLNEYLEEKATLPAILQKTEIASLCVVPAGAITGNTVGLLTKEKLTALFHFLEPQFDYIILDTPPVELASDAYVLANYCDIHLFIVRYGVTPQTLIRRMDENPRLAQFSNLKIIFNGIRGRGFLRKYYGFGFGYGKENLFRQKANKGRSLKEIMRRR